MFAACSFCLVAKHTAEQMSSVSLGSEICYLSGKGPHCAKQPLEVFLLLFKPASGARPYLISTAAKSPGLGWGRTTASVAARARVHFFALSLVDIAHPQHEQWTDRGWHT